MLDREREYRTREPGADPPGHVDREVDEPIRRAERIRAGRGLPHEEHVAPRSVNASVGGYDVRGQRVCDAPKRGAGRLGQDEREPDADPDRRRAPLRRLALHRRAHARGPVGERQEQERARPQRHRARVHAPGRPAPQQPRQRDERHKRAADARAREHVPDARGAEPEPAQGDGRECEEDEEDVVGGGRVAEEEAGEEERADDGDLEQRLCGRSRLVVEAGTPRGF